MYILGGWDGVGSNKNDFFKYNFETKEWSDVPYEGTPPPKLRSHSAVMYQDSMVVFGGYGDTHPVNIYIFHFNTATWKEIEPPALERIPSGRSRFRMVYHEDSLWCFGGWDRKTHFNDLWQFLLNTCTWRHIDAAFELQGLSQHSLVIHKAWMYVYGGYSADSKAPHPDLYVYRLPTRSA
jgi:N-acetylneuraminic acid mutarotase